MIPNMTFAMFSLEQTYVCIIFALCKFDVNPFFRPGGNYIRQCFVSATCPELMFHNFVAVISYVKNCLV